MTDIMFESIQKFWTETMEIDAARWVVWATALLILVLVGVYVAMYFRNMAVGTDGDTSEDLSMFRKLRNEGVLNEQEFKDLKSAIPREQLAGDGVESSSTESDAVETGEHD